MPIRMGDFLDAQAVLLSVEAASAGDVIRLLGQRLEQSGKVRPSYAAAVIEREASMPTGLPLGDINVAVPHTDPEHVLVSALAVATLKSAVPFASMDDPEQEIPVRIVIAMALTEKNAQIDMLQRICGFAKNPAALAAVLQAATAQEVLAALKADDEDG